MNGENSTNKAKNNLTDSDHWFDANLRCLLGSEVELVKQGKKQKIDRDMLAKWIIKYI